MEKVGQDGFVKAPVGTGPYKLTDYQLNSRIVLERNEAYWGPKPAMRNITIQISQRCSARVAAVQSWAGRSHREHAGARSRALDEGSRIQSGAGSNRACDYPSGPRGSRLRQQKMCALRRIMRSTRRRCHRRSTVGPPCLCRLSLRRAPRAMWQATPSPTTWSWRKSRWRNSGTSTSKPAKIKMATTNGEFPGDYDVARAIVQM